MRPSSVISVLAVVAYSLPIAPFNDSLLDGLQDFIYKSVNGLLYPFGLYDRPGCQLLSSNFDPKYCVAQCVPNCTGGAQKVSNIPSNRSILFRRRRTITESLHDPFLGIALLILWLQSARIV
ncbi:hypothetical protein F5Y10DRAFT_230770 [Nemania abortiva]|nr:hypothetical protein F5Y10DRAFT_230770 [Nemania abortiva]